MSMLADVPTVGSAQAPTRRTAAEPTSRPRGRRWSVTVYLALLVGLFAVASGVGVVYVRSATLSDARSAALADAAAAAAEAAQGAAASVQQLHVQAAQTASTPGVSQAFAAPVGCTLTFGGDGVFPSGHIDILRPDGTVACTSLATGRLTAYAGVPWANPPKTVDVDLRTDGRTGNPSFAVSSPIPGGGAIVVFVDLTKFGPAMASTYGGPRHLEFAIADRDRILSRSIDAARWTETPVAGTPYAGGGGNRRDVDGKVRLYGAAPIAGTGWTVFAGADQEAATAAANHVFHRQLTIILAGLAVLVVAALIIQRRIVAPIRKLTAAARQQSASTSPQRIVSDGPTEFVTLADEFNQLMAAAERSARQRQAAEEAYRRIFEDSPLPMWVTDHDTLRFLSVNDAAITRYGYSRDEFLAMTLRDIHAPDEAPEAVARARSDDRFTGSGPWHHMAKDGTRVDVLTTSYMVEFDGRPARFSTAEDLTERERLRAELAQAQRMESLGRLAGGIAHDFGNLIMVISSYGGFIKHQLAAEPVASAEVWSALRDDTEQILRVSGKATALTNQLLAFARGDTIHPEVVDINHVVRGMREAIENTIGADAIVSFALAPDLPPVYADVCRLEQLLMNLAVNARDAMPTGGSFAIETAAVDGGVRLRASDTGTGIDAADLSRVFEPFFTTKATGYGTGLGLATVYSIVTQAGGTISVDSTPGEGSTFTVLLPRFLA